MGVAVEVAVGEQKGGHDGSGGVGVGEAVGVGVSEHIGVGVRLAVADGVGVLVAVIVGLAVAVVGVGRCPYLTRCGS